MIMNIKRYFRHSTHYAAFAITVLAGLTLGSCAEEDLGNRNDDGKGTAVTFNVSSAQDDAQAAAAKAMPGMPVTRAAFSEQLGMMNLTPENLTSQKLAVQGAADLCLIETTTAGIDEMPRQATKDALTRANITTLPNLGHFSSYGYRGTTAGSISSTAWFYNKDTNPNGTLVSPILWAWGQPFGKFYAVYPQVTSSYTKLIMSPESHASTPYVDFEVESDVKNQKDLMTACSGVVHYATQFVAPTTNLKFRHALTAVRFKVGQNLSWNKKITKVEIVGAKSKGRYTLATDENGTNAAWSNLDAPKTFTLSGLSVSTSKAVNNIIMGNAGDNYTFYMIPQSLTGVQVKIYFNNSPTPAITANLAGTWKAGTTKTYALSQNTSDWTYTLTVTSPAAVAYDQTAVGTYTIQSYRTDPVTHTQQPMKWKVAGYIESTDGGATWGPETQTKPAWLTNLSLTEGNGGTTAESGTATLTKNAIDHLSPYNKVLREATPRGSAGNPYDLSMHDFKGNATAKRNTANSYLISAPGWYKIPLVYGNAITNGNNNTNAYISQAPTGTPNEFYVLRHFKDHNNQDITDPWITKSNGGVNAPDGAKIVWTDQSGIVTHLSVSGSGTDAFVNFEVPAAAIKNGNAVIAVTKGGTVVWSWHLWFDHDDVLETIPCTNFQGHVYKFTKMPLGFTYYKWISPISDKPRIAFVKVEQEIPNGGMKKFAYIVITQNSGGVKEIASTLYQWGRKDALPGIDDLAPGSSYSFNSTTGGHSLGYAIQHPENMLRRADIPGNYYDWCNAAYNNLWSADNTKTSYNDDPVVKTVYDPCPAGFKMPASNAFTGFTTNGQSGGPNSSGTWDYGYNFNNKISNPDATIYFPASGFRHDYFGSLYDVGYKGHYWSAVARGRDDANLLYFDGGTVDPQVYRRRAYGFLVRPVAE